MRVANRKCIRRLAFKNLQAAKLRNIITVAAVALTTILFTSLFTIALSIIENFQQSNFRQVGTTYHGIFKEGNQSGSNRFKSTVSTWCGAGDRKRIHYYHRCRRNRNNRNFYPLRLLGI